MDVREIEEVNKLSRGMAAAARAGVITLEDDLPYYGYLTVDRFDCPPFVMFSNNDSPVVKNYLRSGTFEPASMALWCALARDATGILDVGANVGIYALAAAKLRPDLQIHAFEPNPYAYARLRVHKHVNELPNIIEHAVGCGPADAYEEFSWVVKPGGNIASGGGFGKHIGVTERMAVRVIALDGSGIVETLGMHPLVKIDVEGAEAELLRGARTLLERRPDIIIETLIPEATHQLNALIAPLGYEVYGVSEHAARLEPRKNLETASTQSADFNQFLTVRPREELVGLFQGRLTIK